MVVAASVENARVIKAIMRKFELISGLKVNYRKSKLCGVNDENGDLMLMAGVLNCKVESMPFKYLSVPVGSNPRRLATWKPVLENIDKRLSAWKSRFLSLGGRVILINSVLSSIPVYFFSIYKAPKMVKDLIKLQS